MCIVSDTEQVQLPTCMQPHTYTHPPSLSHYRCQVTHFLTFLFAWGLCLCTSVPCPCSLPAWSASQSPETTQQQHGVHHSHLKQHSNNMECITVTWNSTVTTWSASQSVTWNSTATTKVSHVSLFFPATTSSATPQQHQWQKLLLWIPAPCRASFCRRTKFVTNRKRHDTVLTQSV